jgi:regulator of replication initiation timing
MTKTVNDIVKHLPDGISDSGMEEISKLVETVVSERVEEEVKTLAAKVSSYLRMRIDEFKEVAMQELEDNEETFRAVKVYESLKSVIAEDMESKDSESAVSAYKEEVASLQETVDKLNNKLSHTINENSTLEGAVTSLKENLQDLSEVTKEPFKSSESALVITNEDTKPSYTNPESEANMFLTEDVIRLAQNLNN